MDLESFQVRVITSSCSRVPCGPSYLTDIIHNAGQNESFMIKRNSVVYFLLLTETGAASTKWSPEDAALLCADTILRSRSSAICLFHDSYDQLPTDNNSSSTRTIALSMLAASDPASDSVVSWPEESKQNYTASAPVPLFVFGWLKHLDACKHRSKARWMCVLALIWMAIVTGAVFLYASLNSDDPRIWERYDTHGSLGPRYQLQFTHHNVSSWEGRYQSPQDSWFVRIDDQAMMPLDLLDENELRYQRWFQARYPETNDIRLRGDYLKEAFLNDYLAIQVPADKAFHTAHCVLTLRRY